MRVTTPPGRPPPGTRPGEGTLIGRRPAPSGVVVDWPRYATGMATRTSTATLTTPRSGRASRARSSTTSSRQARSFLELVRDAEVALAEAKEPAWAPSHSDAYRRRVQPVCALPSSTELGSKRWKVGQSHQCLHAFIHFRCSCARRATARPCRRGGRWCSVTAACYLGETVGPRGGRRGHD